MHSNAVTQRVSVGKELFGECLVHDHDRGMAAPVLPVEESSADQGNSHGTKIFRRNYPIVQMDLSSFILDRLCVQPNPRGVRDTLKRQEIRAARGFYGGELLDLSDQTFEEPDALPWIAIRRSRERNLHGQYIADLIARAHLSKRHQTPGEKARCRHQYDAERH